MCSPFHLTCRLLNNLCKLQIRSRQISMSDLQKNLESAVTFFFSLKKLPEPLTLSLPWRDPCHSQPCSVLSSWSSWSSASWPVLPQLLEGEQFPLSPVPLPRSTAFSSYKRPLPGGSVFTTRYTSCRGFSSPAAPDWTTSPPKYFPNSL